MKKVLFVLVLFSFLSVLLGCGSATSGTVVDLQLFGGLIAVTAYVPFVASIWRGKTRQSFTTYALWAALNFIAAYALYAQGGNFWLALLFAIGGTSAAISLLLKKCFSWGKLETFVVVLVFVCIGVQYVLGDFWAMIASVFSLTVASIPQIINTYQNPHHTPTKIYTVFAIASFVSLLGAKSFALEEVLHSGSSFLVGLTITLLSMRKKG